MLAQINFDGWLTRPGIAIYSRQETCATRERKPIESTEKWKSLHVSNSATAAISDTVPKPYRERLGSAFHWQVI